MSMKTSCKQLGPTPITKPKSPEAALHREMVELVKVAKELGGKQLVSEYEKEEKYLQEVLGHYPTTLAAQHYKRIEKLTKGLVQELRGKVDGTEEMWQQMTVRENCNKVINAARRWLPDEVLYS